LNLIPLATSKVSLPTFPLGDACPNKILFCLIPLIIYFLQYPVLIAAGWYISLQLIELTLSAELFIFLRSSKFKYPLAKLVNLGSHAHTPDYNKRNKNNLEDLLGILVLKDHHTAKHQTNQACIDARQKKTLNNVHYIIPHGFHLIYFSCLEF
jgi:hypothetical protein